MLVLAAGEVLFLPDASLELVPSFADSDPAFSPQPVPTPARAVAATAAVVTNTRLETVCSMESPITAMRIISALSMGNLRA